VSWNPLLRLRHTFAERAASTSTSALPEGFFPPPLELTLCGRYRLESVITRDGSTVVYRAADVLLNHEVAIHVLCAPEDAVDEENVRAANSRANCLVHPGIVRVLHVDRHYPWTFLVLELQPFEGLQSDDLATFARKRAFGRVPPHEVIDTGLAALDALGYAHGFGITHDDLHPGSLVRSRTGLVRVQGFGLSALSDSAGASATPAAMHMSPERIRGEPCDGRSDLYALASTLFALCTGEPPFGTALALAWQGHLERAVPWSVHIPTPVFAVLRQALEKDPDARFQTAMAMREALVRAKNEMSQPALTPVGPERRAPSRVRTDVIEPPADTQAFVSVPLEPSSPSWERAAYMSELEPLREPPVERRIAFGADEGHRAAKTAPEILTTSPDEDLVFVTPTRFHARDVGSVLVEGFWLSRTPITNQRYRIFVEATGEHPPAHWVSGVPPHDRLDHPVVGVTHAQAARYAAWAGLRLPTCLEWEAASRGPQLSAFPWGATYDAARVNGPEQERRDTTAVTMHPLGSAPSGALDLVGNVWEWTEEDADAPPAGPGLAWAYGGSFEHPCADALGVVRARIPLETASRHLGFRCALAQI
jgi:serine/threonine-protein kinase